MNSRRLFLLGLIGVAVILSGSILAGFQMYKGTVSDRHEAELGRAADHVRSELDARLAGHQETVEMWTNTPAVARHATTAQREALMVFVNETAFSGVSVIAANGTMTNIAAGLPADRRRTLIGRDFSDRTYFRRAMQGDTYVSQPVEAESGNYVITISAPIRRDGRTVGTLNGAFHLSKGTLFKSVGTSLGRTKGLTVRSRSGTVIYQRAPTPNTDLVAANATLRETGWRVSVRESESVIRPTIQRTTYLQFGSLLAVLLSIAVVGWWHYRRNLQQIEPLLRGFDALEAREYGTLIDIGGAEEWERIGDKFNEMSRTLDQYHTEIKEREQELRRFRRAVESAGNAVFITDLEGRIEYVNPAFTAITGYDRDDALGQTPGMLDSGEMPEDYFEKLWTTILSGNVWEEEVINQRADGDLYHAKQTIAPITDDGDEIDGFVAVQSDITERKERESHLQVLARVLRHNLRNELSVIRGRAETIRAEASGRTRADAESIVETSERLLKLGDKERQIVDILVESPERMKLEVAAMLRRPIRAVREAHPAATITVDYPEGISVSAMPQIEDAVEELLTNAIVHNDQDAPEIGVSVTVDEDTVGIEIADGGPRIPSMERRILIQGAEIEPLYHGSGLGLWLVYWIVTRSGGTLAFDENDPRGNRIRVTLTRTDA